MLHRAARVLLVALLGPAGCSLSLDGDVFRDGDGGGMAAAPDAGGGSGGSQGDAGVAEPGPDAGSSASDASPGEPGEPDAAAEECTGSCMMCGGGCCTETCGGQDNCRLNCNREGCDCTLDCAATEGTCEPRCERGASCAIDCSDVNDCRPRCREAECEIDCTGANNCDKVECAGGASCLLDCAGANNCQFERCEGEQLSCAGGIVACNRDCP